MIKEEKNGVRIPVRRENQPEVYPESEAEQNQVEEETPVNLQEGCDDAVTIWRDTALRLKAEMHNYHKRQQRWAQDEINREKDQLLLGFVEVLDDLEQAVTHLDPTSVTHQGVKIAYDRMLKLLGTEGVERIHAKNSVFDPMWHEAVAVVPGPETQSDGLLVSEVVNNGYRIGDRVLKPSRVVVSKRRN
jgi:molecular chaperone GrpE